MRASMDKFRVLVQMYMKVHRKYPMELFLKLIYLPVQMLMYGFLWKSLLKYNGLELRYMICYYLFSILLGYAFPFVHIATDIQEDVQQGMIMNYLVRPVHYVMPIIAKYVAWLLCYFVVLLPAFALTIYYYGISFHNFINFIIYLIMGIGIEFLIWFDLGLLSLKREKIRGIVITFHAFKSLVSGSLIPLSLFPQTLRTLTEILPMRFYIFTPINALLSEESTIILAKNMALSITWIAILAIVAVLEWNVGLKAIQTNIS